MDAGRGRAPHPDAELHPPVDIAPWTPEEYHGTRDGVIGLPVPSGKIADRDGVDLRTALRELTADGTVGQLRVTPRQDLLLFDIAPGRIPEVEDRLRAHGVALAGDISALRRLAIACPALPTCGQALGEAERVLPDLVTQLEKVFADTGTGDADIRLNMTGCPNGCARPYTAEIGIVGRTKTTYDVYVGGSASGERLAERIRADVPLDQLPAVLAPVLARYAASARAAGLRRLVGRRRRRDDLHVAPGTGGPPPIGASAANASRASAVSERGPVVSAWSDARVPATRTS